MFSNSNLYPTYLAKENMLGGLKNIYDFTTYHNGIKDACINSHRHFALHIMFIFYVLLFVLLAIQTVK